jgi:hypothetical protein
MTRRRRTGSKVDLPNPLPSDVPLTLGELGVEVEKVDRDEAWAICPNPKHSDRDPSWSIHVDTGEHHCFSCGFGGTFIWLVLAVKDWDWKKSEDVEKAEDWIRKRGGISVARKKLRGETAAKTKDKVEISEADLALYDSEIPLRALRKRDIIQEACEAYGVLWNSRRDSWIIPVRDPFTGELRGWQEKSKTLMLNHPEGLEKADTLFGYPLLEGTAYVEESPLDCLRLWTYGVDGAVSGYGVHLSDTQMDLIVEHPRVKRVVMCLDNDKAGRTKEIQVWQEYRHRTRLYFADYSGIKAKDHGDMTPEEIARSIEHPISAVRFRP